MKGAWIVERTCETYRHIEDNV